MSDGGISVGCVTCWINCAIFSFSSFFLLLSTYFFYCVLLGLTIVIEMALVYVNSLRSSIVRMMSSLYNCSVWFSGYL